MVTFEWCDLQPSPRLTRPRLSAFLNCRSQPVTRKSQVTGMRPSESRYHGHLLSSAHVRIQGLGEKPYGGAKPLFFIINELVKQL